MGGASTGGAAIPPAADRRGAANRIGLPVPPSRVADHRVGHTSKRKLGFAAYVRAALKLYVRPVRRFPAGGERRPALEFCSYVTNEAPMIKKLSAVGNSLGLIIERPILDLLGITKDTALEIKTDGEALIIRPAKLSKKERIRASTKRMMVVHDQTLRKLAK